MVILVSILRYLAYQIKIVIKEKKMRHFGYFTLKSLKNDTERFWKLIKFLKFEQLWVIFGIYY